MNVTINLFNLLKNAYLCSLVAESVKYRCLLDHSAQGISLNNQLLLNSSKYDMLHIEMNEEDSKILVKDGFYEGGFAVWESNWHFLEFLKSNLPNTSKGKALDLGCGCGFVGILAFTKGYDVCFQEMNIQVIQRSLLYNFIVNYWFNFIKSNDLSGISLEKVPLLDTITFDIIISNTLDEPNQSTSVLLDLMIKFKWIDNLSNTSNRNNSIGLTCSTWENLINNPKADLAFDYILSSETLYRTQEYLNIGKILEMYLSTNGIAYFATKRFYFGIGGGSFEFIDHIQKHHNSTLKANIIKSITNHRSSNPIDIIKISRQ